MPDDITAAFEKHGRCQCQACREARRLNRIIKPLKRHDQRWLRQMHQRLVTISVLVEEAGVGGN